MLISLDKLDNIESNTVNYIKEHMLYEECDYNLFVTVDDIKKDLEKELKPSRYNHTLGVMYTAINLGMKYDIPLKLCEYAGLLHDAAKSFSNVEIQDAIKYHTTGAPNMDLLSKIIYVADYIEPNRSKANRLNEIRAMAYYNIDIATAMILQDTIGYLKDINAFIDDTTIKTFEYYKNTI